MVKPGDMLVRAGGNVTTWALPGDVALVQEIEGQMSVRVVVLRSRQVVIIGNPLTDRWRKLEQGPNA